MNFFPRQTSTRLCIRQAASHLQLRRCRSTHLFCSTFLGASSTTATFCHSFQQRLKLLTSATTMSSSVQVIVLPRAFAWDPTPITCPTYTHPCVTSGTLSTSTSGECKPLAYSASVEKQCGLICENGTSLAPSEYTLFSATVVTFVKKFWNITTANLKSSIHLLI